MRFGCQSMSAPLRDVLLKRPRDAFRSPAHIAHTWRDLNFLAPPDFDQACTDHDRFVELLSRLGVTCHFCPTDNATDLDSLYVRDPFVMAHHGAIIGRMGKLQRRPETDVLSPILSNFGIPILGRITGDGLLEGGDVVWLDERTVAVGEGYRTNAAGIDQFTKLLGRAVDTVISVPLPHWDGPGDVLHLMSMLSPVDTNLCVVYSRLMSVSFRDNLLARGMILIEVPETEYPSLGCNILAVAPRVCIMVAGNPRTQGMLESAGCTVHTYEGNEISLKGSGGPTCLTQPFLRDLAP